MREKLRVEYLAMAITGCVNTDELIDKLVEVLTQEIKKVENPYKYAERVNITPTKDGVTETYQINTEVFLAFEECRQKILNLLEG